MTTKRLYCGDCIHLTPKRDKNGVVTGEVICDALNQERSVFQYTSECSDFFPKSIAPELYEALKAIINSETIMDKDNFNNARDALSKVKE